MTGNQQRETFRRRLDIDETSSSASSSENIHDEEDEEEDSKSHTSQDEVSDWSDWTSDDDDLDDRNDVSNSTAIRKLLLKDGAVYIGNVNEAHRPHKRGEMKFPDGSKYVGEWVRGKMQGKGIYRFPDGSIYEGSFFANKCVGEGKFSLKNNRSTYIGEWKDGKPSGLGALTTENGISYKGGWLNGQADGSGELQERQWGRYQGLWKNGLRNGAGVFEGPRGVRFEGSMIDDKIEGLATVHLPDGATFTGYYVNGELQGSGTFSSPVNTKTGKQTIFTGAWRGNTKEGLIFRSGRLVFSDGAVYEGDWINDRPHGRGLFINPYGVLFRGVWAHGMFQAAESGYDPKGICTFQMEGEDYIKATMEQHSTQTMVHPSVEPGDPQSHTRLPSTAVGSRLLSQEPKVYVGEPFESVVYPREDHEEKSSCPIDSGYIYITQYVTEYWPDETATIITHDGKGILSPPPSLVATAPSSPQMTPEYGEETRIVKNSSIPPLNFFSDEEVKLVPTHKRAGTTYDNLVTRTSFTQPGQRYPSLPSYSTEIHNVVVENGEALPNLVTRTTIQNTLPSRQFSPPPVLNDFSNRTTMEYMPSNPVESSTWVMEETSLYPAQQPPRYTSVTSTTTTAYRSTPPQPSWVTEYRQTITNTPMSRSTTSPIMYQTSECATTRNSSPTVETPRTISMSTTLPILNRRTEGVRRSRMPVIQEEVRDTVRRIPKPVESVLTIELALPKINTIRKTLDMPVYVPRLIEVPVGLDSLTMEGLDLYEEISELIERNVVPGLSSGRQYDETVSRICHVLNQAKYTEGTMERPIKPKDLGCFIGVVTELDEEEGDISDEIKKC